MARSKVVAALALVVALSFAVPALAGKSSPLKVAKQALGLSKKADKRSRTALARANTANTTATAALAKAGAPLTEAVHAQNADHATNADHAANADHATNADKTTKADAAGALDGFTVLPLIKASPNPGSSSGSDPEVARTASPEIPLFSKGPLRIYGKCYGYNDGNPNTQGAIYLATSQDGVVYSANQSGSNNGFLFTGTNESNRALLAQDSADPVGVINATDAVDGSFYAVAPDGTTLQGALHLVTKVGTVTGGDGPFPPGGGCLFTGAVTAS
jgi:hypothetical protein